MTHLKIFVVIGTIGVALALGLVFIIWDTPDTAETRATKSPNDAETGEQTQETGLAIGELKLSPESLAEAGVRIERLVPISLSGTIAAPAEIMANAYRSSIITPRVPAIVVERHARLSGQVEPGQPLVTLFSRDVASAEGQLLVANQEWQRVRDLGRKVVSGKRYVEAQVARKQAEAQLLAFGLEEAAIQAILDGTGAHKPGGFDLVADQAGTIVADEFRDGELIEPGRILFEIVDLSDVWIETRVAAAEASRIRQGARAWVKIGGTTHEATVQQVRASVDEETRTTGVRLVAPNKTGALRPGQFAQAEIEVGDGEPLLAVPNDGLGRNPDGDWVIFVQDEDGGIAAKEIRRVRVVGDHTVIEGVAPGAAVAISGAFFLQSELAKGGFDIHNH